MKLKAIKAALAAGHRHFIYYGASHTAKPVYVEAYGATWVRVRASYGRPISTNMRMFADAVKCVYIEKKP